MIPSFPITYYPYGGQLPMPISDDAGKIFVGGIPAEATKDSLTDYFQQFGEVSDSIIMVDNATTRSRGFGFVTFIEASTVNKVLAHPKHVIHGKVVDAKKAVPKGPNQSSILRAMGITSNRADRNPECKVFVGGVAQGTTETDLESHFQVFGKVLEVKIPKDQNTNRARGFAFVLFEDRDCVISATKDRYQKINAKMVEVKTVHLPSSKDDLDGSDEGLMQSPPSPYMQMSPRPSYYPYASTYLGVNPGSGGIGAGGASIGSAGYGTAMAGTPGSSRMEEYPYMASLYPAMSDLSINQQYAATRYKRYFQRVAPMNYGVQQSSEGAMYAGGPEQYTAPSPVYPSIHPQATAVAAAAQPTYVPGSTPPTSGQPFVSR